MVRPPSRRTQNHQAEPPSCAQSNTARRSLELTTSGYDAARADKLREIKERLSQARRELDALIGDAYLRPRASIVPVHFLDLASAVEKLRWAEKEWRELDEAAAAVADIDDDEADEADPEPALILADSRSGASR